MKEISQELLLKAEKLTVIANLLKIIDVDDKRYLTSDMLNKLKFEIQETHVTFLAHFYEDEDRYVVLDPDGFDHCGEHYSLEEATRIVNELNK